MLQVIKCLVSYAEKSYRASIVFQFLRINDHASVRPYLLTDTLAIILIVSPGRALFSA